MTDRDIVIDTCMIPDIPRLRERFIQCDNLIRSLYNWKKEWNAILRGYIVYQVALVEKVVEELREMNKCFDERGMTLPRDLEMIQRRSGAKKGDLELAKVAWHRVQMRRETIILTNNVAHFPVAQFRNFGISIWDLVEFAPELA